MTKKGNYTVACNAGGVQQVLFSLSLLIEITVFITSRRESFTFDIETMLSTCNSGLSCGLSPNVWRGWRANSRFAFSICSLFELK